MRRLFFLSILLASTFVFSQKKWTLRECVDYAVKNNLQVINNQYNNDIQSKNLAMAKNDYLPSASANIGNNVRFGQVPDNAGNSLRTDAFSNSASLGVSMDIYNNGRIKKTVQKSQYDLDASFLDTEKTKNDISLQVAQLYLQVLLNKEVKKITDESVIMRKKF